jgi:hypothetical protein
MKIAATGGVTVKQSVLVLLFTSGLRERNDFRRNDHTTFVRSLTHLSNDLPPPMMRGRCNYLTAGTIQYNVSSFLKGSSSEKISDVTVRGSVET